MVSDAFRHLLVLALAIAALVAAPVDAAADRDTVAAGRCGYAEGVARYRDEAVLILCDYATIERDGAATTMVFGQRDWGAMARFSGTMAGDTMAVSRVTLRRGPPVAATGACAIVRRKGGDDAGGIAAIRCLATGGPRPVAANFIASGL